jgi:hypothetical protein
LVFGTGVFLVATAVVGMGWLTITPISLASLVFANGILGGAAHEYGVWLKKTRVQHKPLPLPHKKQVSPKENHPFLVNF